MIQALVSYTVLWPSLISLHPPPIDFLKLTKELFVFDVSQQIYILHTLINSDVVYVPGFKSFAKIPPCVDQFPDLWSVPEFLYTGLVKLWE